MRLFTACGFSRHSKAAIAATGLLISASAVAQAGPTPYPNAGTINPTTYSFTAAATGDVVAHFAGSGAAFTETLGLFVNGTLTAAGFGLNDHTSTIGQSFDFGLVNAGDTLVFGIKVQDEGDAIAYSNPILNASYDNTAIGYNHIYSMPYVAASGGLAAGIPSGTYVGFEDLPFAASDFNYTDETYVFTDIATATTTANVPEPASIALISTGLIAFGLFRRSPWKQAERS